MAKTAIAQEDEEREEFQRAVDEFSRHQLDALLTDIGWLLHDAHVLQKLQAQADAQPRGRRSRCRWPNK